MRQRSSISVILVALAACSGRSSGNANARHIATLKDSGECATENGSIYILGGSGIYRVSEQNGEVTFLTNDLGIASGILVEHGSIYWADQDGIEVFTPGAAARKTLVGDRESPPTSLTRFGDKMCWAKSIDPAKVQCMTFADHSIVSTMNVSVGIDKLASNGHQLFAIEDNLDGLPGEHRPSRVEEIPPTGDTPQVLADIPFQPTELGALDDGPVWFSRLGLWRIDHGTVRQLGDLKASGTFSSGRLLTASGRIFATTPSSVVQVDPRTGAVTELAKTHDGTRICADRAALYYEDRGDLFQLRLDH